MAKRGERSIESTDNESKRPLQYEDFIRLNPYLRDWMLPYLPESVYGRDIVISVVATVFGTAVAVLMMSYLGSLGVVLGLVVIVITLWLFMGEVQGRYAGVSVKFWMEKMKNDRQ